MYIKSHTSSLPLQRALLQSEAVRELITSEVYVMLFSLLSFLNKLLKRAQTGDVCFP